MTDQWFDEYMYRLVVEKKYVPADILKMLEQKPILLPAWDPMFAPEEQGSSLLRIPTNKPVECQIRPVYLLISQNIIPYYPRRIPAQKNQAYCA